jgi:signal transduction histidine kinase
MQSDNTKYQRLLKREQIKGILEQSPTNIIANTVVALLSFWAFYNEDAATANYQVLWLVVTLTTSSFQAIEVYKTKSRPLNSESGYQLLNGSIVVAFVIGVIWSFFIFLFFDENPESVYLMAALTCGMLAGAIGSTSILLKLYILFSAPFISSFIFRLSSTEHEYHLILSLLMVIYYLMCLNMAYILNKRVKESFYLRFENYDVLQALTEQKEIAENANIAKSKFLAATSHDLRQPLHALGFFIDALKVSPEKSEELLIKIDSSISNLKELFDALLDISKLDSGIITLHKKHFCIKPILQQIENEFVGEAKRKNLKLIISKSNDTLFTDPAILHRVIANLISNSIRYTSSGGIELSVRHSNYDNKILISIEDTGIGIEKKEQHNIFTEFYQVNNPERDRNNGLGLGLAIVNKLNQLASFELEIESELNVGSLFNLKVEKGIQKKIIKEISKESYQNKDLLNKNIIVIDDEIEILNAMTYALKNWGCNVLTCESENEAISKIKSLNFNYDIIISDLRLRDNNTGINAINSIFELTKRKTPALLITGDTSPEILAEVKKSGLTLLHKPLKPAQLRLQLIKLFN